MPAPASSSTAMTVALWAVTALAALMMGAAGASKWLAAEMWDELFTSWSYSLGFKNLIGVLEIVGAAAILVPRLATYGAALVCAIMLGAIYTVAAHGSDLGFVANATNLVLFAIVGYARRGERWKPGG